MSSPRSLLTTCQNRNNGTMPSSLHIPGEKATNCKVYPLSPKEQKELDKFLKENLESGQIWPSKSLMASLVFFIKKDGSL